MKTLNAEGISEWALLYLRLCHWPLRLSLYFSWIRERSSSPDSKQTKLIISLVQHKVCRAKLERCLSSSKKQNHCNCSSIQTFCIQATYVFNVDEPLTNYIFPLFVTIVFTDYLYKGSIMHRLFKWKFFSLKSRIKMTWKKMGYIYLQCNFSGWLVTSLTRNLVRSGVREVKVTDLSISPQFTREVIK